jgi:hypothetical protein
MDLQGKKDSLDKVPIRIPTVDALQPSHRTCSIYNISAFEDLSGKYRQHASLQPNANEGKRTSMPFSFHDFCTS